jgi:aminopeptidase N
LCDGFGPMQRTFAFPGSRPRYAPDRVVDVEHYKIELAIDVDAARISGTCALTVSPILAGVKRLELDAVDLEIARVRWENGTSDLAFRYDGLKLTVELGDALPLGKRRTLVVDYAGKPRRGLYFIAPDQAYPERPKQVWSQGQDEDSRHWFPCYDAPNQKSTSELVVTVPAGWYALSNGTLVSRQPGRFHWKFDVRHSCYLITLAAGELVELEDSWEGIAVNYYVPKGREADAHRSLGRTPEMLALFSEKFGVRYPYEKYAQVCVAEFIFGGMENTTATTLTDNALFDERAAIDYDTESLVAHELAHQWFGDLVTCRDWGQGWLNEGFATYSEYVWREHAEGREAAAVELSEWADQYFGEDSRRYRRAIATNVYEEPIDVFDHHLYEKGGLVLHMLRQILGEEPFWGAIRHYLEKHRTKSVETRDLARAIEEATGRSVDWFFDQWVHKAGHPELKVEYGWDAEAKLARFTVKQTQKVTAETPLFRLPLSVRLRVDGKDVTVPLEIKDDAEVFYIGATAEPTQAIFDTGQHTLKRAEVTKPRPLWLAELAGATDAADRMAAARALGKQTSADVVKALATAVEKDKFWGVSSAAAEALGDIRTAAARDALITAMARVKHARARRAVVRALGGFRHDSVAAEALAAKVRTGDESYFVEAESCLAIGRTRSPLASDVLRDAITRESYLDVIRQFAYRGLAEARDESAIPILVEGTRYGHKSQGRRAALAALALLAAGRSDREAREVREKIEEMLADPDFRVQQSALEALAVQGDARALPALRRAVDTTLDGRIRRRGREIIRDLEEGRSREEAVRNLRDELDRLRQEMSGMRERMFKLEAKGKDPASPDAKKSRPPKAKAKSPAPRGKTKQKRR